MENNAHIWHFSRIGGVNRVSLETGNDLVQLGQLDQKLWTALSCPVHGLEIDAKTLELIDSDKDNRIRVPEILEATRWLTSLIKNPDDILKGSAVLPLSAINDETDEGKNLLASARQILINIGKADATEISVDDTSDTVRIFAETRFNGDGIITEEASDDEAIRQTMRDIIACMGSVTDRNGKEGISMEQIETFYQNCEDYAQWYGQYEADPEKIAPFGESTAGAYAAFLAVKSKIDDYFLRCRLAQYDTDSTAILNTPSTQYDSISTKDLNSCMDDIAAFPLAKIETMGILSLVRGINPAWEKALDDFRQLVVVPVCGHHEILTEEDMETISRRFDDYQNWQNGKCGTAVEALGIATIHETLAGNTKETLCALIEQDKALETASDNILLVEKLVRYYRDLYLLLKNYVTFHDFYSPGAEAIFQVGKLYIDQRCCDLCLRVNDMSKHNSFAGLSGICLLYCSCYSKTLNEKMTIVAALTDGDFKNISVGRNAIFYDKKGNDWDATIIKVIDHPISIRQAFWLPYRRVSQFFSSQIEKFASSKDKEVHTAATTHIETTATKADHGITQSIHNPDGTPAAPVTPPPAAAQQPFDIGKFVGIFAAISLAIGAIGSAIATLLTGFFSLAVWKMPLAIFGFFLVFSGPSMILTWLKLRRRNLAPLLDANGWAINAQANINIAFGHTLTHLAKLPPNAKLNTIDPFARKKNPLWLILMLIIIVLGVATYLAWHSGLLKTWGII